jgi:hypothetical protein
VESPPDIEYVPRGQERIDMNIYDSFVPTEVRGGLRLFGNKNLGQTHLTNMQVAGQFASDQRATIQSWYARTDAVSDWSAWLRWIHATTAEVVIGMKPYRQRSLGDLLERRSFGSCCGPAGPGGGDDYQALAAEMFARHETRDLNWHEAYRQHNAARDAFIGLPEEERDRWLSAARVYPFTRPLVVGVRQNFCVRLETEMSALAALSANDPQPRIWIHLEGALTRHVI